MTRSTLRLALAPALVLALTACDEGEELTPTPTPDVVTQADTSDADAGADAGSDVPDQTVRYFAVYVADTAGFDCSPNSKNHGADVDAAELKDALTGDSAGYVTSAGGSFGDGSPNCTGAPDADKQVAEEFTGAPDGDLSGGFVALAGGYVTGEFDGTEITSAYTIQIYEVGVEECGNQGCKDDPMEIGLATDAQCDVAGNACSVLLTAEAVGDASVPVGAF